jgi:hypothetical protein
VVITDVNGDGRPDLAVANSSSTVSLLLNTTPVGGDTASFSSQQTFNAGISAEGIIAPDLNGDGRPDLALSLDSDGLTNNVSVLVNGTIAGAHFSSFVPVQSFAVSSLTKRIATGDFNGDGRPDLVVINYSDSTVSVLLNQTTAVAPTTQSATVTVAQGQNTTLTLVGTVPYPNHPLTFTVISPPAHGTLGSLTSTNGRITYTPFPNYLGSDSFQYIVTDTTTGLSSAGAATVSITVAVPPTANPLSVVAARGRSTAVTLTGTAPNGDLLTFTITSPPVHGTLNGLNGATGQVTYTPTGTYIGPDSFAFTSTDTLTLLTSAPVTVSITVAMPPMANPLSVGVPQGLSRVITLTGSAPNNDPLSFTLAANPSHGTLSGFNAATGQFTYSPTGNYTGTDSFTFTVTDTTTNLASTPATVSIIVAAPPTANSLAMTVAQGQGTTIILSGSSSPPNEPLTFSVTLTPAHGTLSSLTSTTGRITYTPFPNYLGLDSFQFTVTDTTTGVTSVAAATVGLTVAVPPTASPQAVALVQGQSAPVTLTGTAPNGDPLTFALTAQPAHGTLSGFDSTAGAVTYTPTGNYVGTDSFTFTITDTTTGLVSAPAIVRLTVSAARALVAQFGSTGVWQFDRSTGTWAQLTPANASLLAMDTNGDVAAEFPGYGLWEYQPGSGWKLLHGVDVSLLTMNASGTIAVEFPGYGVGQYTPGAGWRLLTGANASQLAIDANGDIAGAFPRYGVWEFQSASGWHQLNGVDVTLLAMDPQGDVAANFRGYGVGEYSPGTGWRLLNGTQASALALDPQGDVLANFVGYGVAEYVAGSGWRSLTTANAAALAADDSGTIYGAFAGFGVWQYDPTRGWFQLRTTDAAVLAAR